MFRKQKYPAMLFKISILILIGLFFEVKAAISNNIQVTSATLTGQVTQSNYTMVQFNLSWENSWRDNINWDAAWIFVKYKASYDTTWKHAALSVFANNHIVPAGFTCFPSSDAVGVFIYRTSNGNGNVNLQNVQLHWDYGVNGLNDADQVQVKVFAIEMVYVPQGSFYAGDGTINNVAAQFSAGTTTAPLLISSEAGLTLGGASPTNLGNRNAAGMIFPDDFNNITTQSLPVSFPKGYLDFYCMKYEISQGQYTEFLNTLTRTQQKNRVFTDVSTDVIANTYVMTNSNFSLIRSTITCPSSGNGTVNPVIFSCNRPDRACNALIWTDGCAYADWAGLRPMTDLEFEKACRGPLTPVADEFAWGNTTIVPATDISGTENGTEFITTPGANCNANVPSLNGGDFDEGPLRCGILATQTSTRQTSGATYYGIMEMSGNVAERIVSVGVAQGRSYTGQHGDGILSPLGFGNVPNWPGNISGVITSNTGAGMRGGWWATTGAYTVERVSDRSNAGSFDFFRTANYTSLGFRCVHTAPSGTLQNLHNGNQKF